jgi:pimeloyl-ACP methyl ester carboxylesterase
MLNGFIRSGSLHLEALQSDARSRSVVLLCHSNSTSAAMFLPLFQHALAGVVRLVAISLPGHGGSDRCPTPDGYSLPRLARLVADVALSLDADRLILCGHSLGGHLMTEALPLLPNARALMLISSPPLSQATLPLTFRPDPTLGSLFAPRLSQEQVSAFATSILRPELVDSEQFTNVVSSLKATDWQFRPALGRSVAGGEFGDEVRVLREAAIPIAVVGGTKDPFIQSEAYLTVRAGQLWRETPFVLDAAGHSPHLEVPSEFNELFAHFIASV